MSSISSTELELISSDSLPTNPTDPTLTSEENSTDNADKNEILSITSVSGGGIPILSEELLSSPFMSPTSTAGLVVTDFLASNTSNISPLMLTPGYSSNMSTINLTTPYAMTPSSNVVITPDSILFSPVTGSAAPLYVPGVNLSYVNPTLSTYYNLNADNKIHKKLAKYFYFKAIEEWLYDELSELMGYVVLGSGKAKLVSRMSEFDKRAGSKNSNDIMKKKIDFLVDSKILSQRHILTTLALFVEETNAEWIRLPEISYYVRKAIKKSLIKRIKSRVGK